MLLLATDAVLPVEPVPPVDPEPPLSEDGLAIAEEVALPVSPELVELDVDCALPVSPVTATGTTVAPEPPPSPPLAAPTPTLDPPPAAAGATAAGRADEAMLGLTPEPEGVDTAPISTGWATGATVTEEMPLPVAITPPLRSPAWRRPRKSGPLDGDAASMSRAGGADADPKRPKIGRGDNTDEIVDDAAPGDPEPDDCAVAGTIQATAVAAPKARPTPNPRRQVIADRSLFEC